MIVGMRKGATPEEINGVVEKAKSLGLGTQLNLGTDKTVVALLGSNTGQLPIDIFALLPGVESVARIMKPYKLASREFKSQDSIVSIDGIEIGGNRIVVMAGPCAVENEEQLAVPSNHAPPPSAFRGWRRPAWSCWRELRSSSTCL